MGQHQYRSGELDKMSEIDPIKLEVIKHALTSIADEMALIIMRCAYSPIVRDTLDYSTAVCDRDGRLVAQGLTVPLHLASFPSAMKCLKEQYDGKIFDGDIFAFNDPYLSGGMHLPDVYVVKPIFVDGELEGFAIALAHQSDIGGIAPGGTSVEAYEIFQEGLRIPTLKLFERGVPNETLFKIIEANTRLPTSVVGDIQSQLAAVHHAAKSYERLIIKYGVEQFRLCLAELQNYAEKMMRAEIAALPDGEFEFSDYCDGLGENPERIFFKLKLTIRGDELIADWTGTAPQVKGAINCPIPYTAAAVYAAIRCVTDAEIPNCEGYMVPIRIIAPEGTIVNPIAPAACAARGVTGQRALDCMFGALSRIVPERVTAASDGGPVILTIAGWEGERRCVLSECLLGSWGGSVHHDGSEGVSTPGMNLTNYPVELAEAEYPVQILSYALVPDTGGPGRHRGGLAIKKEYRVLMERAILTVRSDRRDHPPWGLLGGGNGAASWNIVNPGPGQRVLPQNPMEQVPIGQGDVFAHIGAGGGGFGHPLERDPDHVLRDVIEEKETTRHALQTYGVVIDGKSMSIDREGTIALRKKMQASA
jgi:N-methylhydantoinase B